MSRLFATLALVGSVAISVAACGSDAPDANRTIAVPGDAATVAEAVKQAKPGDTVQIAPGTYHEAVTVEVDGITIRGQDRNTVVLDGQHSLPSGFTVNADNVAIENVTVHSYTQNGVLFNGTSTGEAEADTVYGIPGSSLQGYRVSYVTSYNNGTYGIYAFAANGGLIEYSYVSGHPDSGIYVGQCKPCDVVIRNVIAERNAIGYYGTNASGGVYVINSVFRNNRLGVTPNSQLMEKLTPQAETVVAGNLVIDNDDPDTPEIANGFFGGGIAIGGGTRNTIVRNRVEGHDYAGIMLVSLNEFEPSDNRVEGNVLADNAIDLLYAPSAGATNALRNCFAGNTFITSLPEAIETVMPCDGASSLGAPPTPPTVSAPDGIDYRTLPAPPAQVTMPAAAAGKLAGAGPVPVVDLDEIVVPSR